MLIFILQMKNLRHEKIKYAAHNWQSWNLNPESLIPVPRLLPMVHIKQSHYHATNRGPDRLL